MDDIKQRDLSGIPEARMTAAERKEFERRKMEFLAVLRRKGGLSSEAPAPQKKQPVKWDPRAAARR